MKRPVAVAAAVLFCTVSADQAHAREDVAGDVPTYGTGAITDVAIPAWGFRPLDSTVTFATNVNPKSIYRTNAAGSAFVVAPLVLPAGAQIVRLEMQACDTSAANDIQMHLLRQPRTGQSENITTVSTTGSPGCVNQLVNLTTPHTVNNFGEAYFVEVNLGSSDASTRLAAARVGYRLQVSPAPATATFPNDVPVGHPLHRFVEALAAAGITGGCAANSFCPDSTVTRGQMAVFLATALGLHWAP